MKKILVLFANEWDLVECSSERYRGQYQFLFEGFDLFKAPENARLMTFNALRFIERIVKKYQRANLAGVISTDEQIGSMVAACITQRLGLPGAHPQAILTAQHKFYSRQLQARAVPEATPRYSVFPYRVGDASQLGLAFPMFVKPVKATFSILARAIGDFDDLRKLVSFGPLEWLILKRLVKPYNDLMRVYTNFDIDAEHLVAEELLSGWQVCLDGFVDRGRVQVLGIVDEVMFPGTIAFERFEYPSRLPQGVQLRMHDLARRLVDALELRHGAFNVEFFYQPESGRITLIEINPRLAYQFADLYEKVDGFNPYDLLLDLSTGVTPRITRRTGAYRYAASFVLRDFAGRSLTMAPSDADLKRLREQHRDARVMIYIKRGASLAREQKWLGSYRYAIVNLGAMSADDLFTRYHSLRSQLNFAFA